ncbi:MAG TPA: hypothetical protein VHB73_00795 [Alphaproteobacteria bacterium]|nr:hypothetical protein [Alphaproteobacteria bacterium]
MTTQRETARPAAAPIAFIYDPLTLPQGLGHGQTERLSRFVRKLQRNFRADLLKETGELAEGQIGVLIPAPVLNDAMNWGDWSNDIGSRYGYSKDHPDLGRRSPLNDNFVLGFAVHLNRGPLLIEMTGQTPAEKPGPGFILYQRASHSKYSRPRETLREKVKVELLCFFDDIGRRSSHGLKAEKDILEALTSGYRPCVLIGDVPEALRPGVARRSCGPVNRGGPGES